MHVFSNKDREVSVNGIKPSNMHITPWSRPWSYEYTLMITQAMELEFVTWSLTCIQYVCDDGKKIKFQFFVFK